MLHSGVSSAAPYFDQAVEADRRIFGVAYLWRPKGSRERWLIPHEWVRVDVSESGAVTGVVVTQPGPLGEGIIKLPGDRVEFVK